MRVFDLINSEGDIFAFEIQNFLLGRRAAARIIKQVPGTTVLRAPKSFLYFREEVFCEFDLAGCKFKVWEPFGDNSRYHIGPEDNKRHAEIDILRESFRRMSRWNKSWIGWLNGPILIALVEALSRWLHGTP